MWTRLFIGPEDWTAALLAAAGTILVAAFVARLLTRMVAAMFVALAGDARENDLVRRSLRVISTIITLLLIAVLLYPAAQLAGLEPRPQDRFHDVLTWLLGSGVRILVVTLLAYTLTRASTLLVRRFEGSLSKHAAPHEIERIQRARTLGSVINKALSAVIALIAGLMILRQIGLDITPVLTGAGIFGLAVGFGAQALVRDVISGFFLLLEDQVRVGDAATINGVGGTIEQVNLRTVVIRDIEGTLHIFPNGAIETLANSSRDFAYYVIDLNVSYREDPDKVVEILRRVSVELREDPALAPFILEPVEVFGVDAFTDRAATMRFRIKTVPMRQGMVGRAFRKRLMQALGQGNIEMPRIEEIVTLRRTTPPAGSAA